MNKKGFTLAEFLVAIGIVGIVAAITIPSVNRILPDKDKGTVLKIYKTINEINAEIFNNPSLYRFDNTPNCEAPYILRCSAQPLDENYTGNNYEGYNKYPSLLLKHLTTAENITVDNGNCSFSTSDGTEWSITLKDSYSSENKSPDSYTIQINTNRTNRKNCLYSSECKNPRLFKFIVNNKGEVKASDDDYLTQAFLENPDELNTRSADLRRAAVLESASTEESSSQ